MGIKLSNYINDSNRKMSDEKIRKHLIKILYPEIYDAIYKKTNEEPLKRMVYKNKSDKNIHLNQERKSTIIESVSDIEYNSTNVENPVFNHYSYLGAAS